MLAHLLPPTRREAPRKKLRGKKRYFRRVCARAEALSLSVGDEDWYDLWHYHPDWYGYGNRSWAMRARHLEAVAYAQCARQLSRFSQPYQLWIYLDAHDASQDAVYVHSPNPNRSNFPLVFDGAEWGVSEVAQFFADLLPGYRLMAARLPGGYLVCSPDVGLPLTT